MQPSTSTPVPRPNRIPRLPAPRPGLFRRLHAALLRPYLRWLLRDLTRQAEQVEQQLMRDAEEAHELSRRMLYSRALAHRRRGGRAHLAELRVRIRTVQQELDALECVL